MNNIFFPIIHGGLVSLKDAFSKRGIVFGMAGEHTSFDNWGGLIKTHAASMTTEVSLKMEFTQPVQDMWSFLYADALVEKCHAEGITVHGHCVMWHMQNPAWLFPTLETMTYDERQNVLYKHVKNLVSHYKDKLVGLDLVNEYGAILEYGSWGAYLGRDCVPFAYNVARQYAGDMKLYYNSFFPSEEDVDLAISLLPLVDGIGIQLHLYYGQNLDAHFTKLRRLIEACRAANKPVRFSECTVLNAPDGTMDDVVYMWRRIVRFAMEYPFTVVALTQWGVKYPAWDGRHVLFDREGKPTLAFYAVIDELRIRE